MPAPVAEAIRPGAFLGGSVQVLEAVCARWRLSPDMVIDAADPEAFDRLIAVMDHLQTQVRRG